MRALAKIGNRAHAKKGNQNTRVISEITVDMQLAFPVPFWSACWSGRSVERSETDTKNGACAVGREYLC